jgi:hypothetical protein
MSREAPPESPPDVRVAPPEAHHAAVWLALPLVALALPVAYRLVVTGDLDDALRVRFVSREITRFWYAATFVSALVLTGFMAARRRGRTVWPAMDVMVAGFPWVIALAAQSLVAEPSQFYWEDGDNGVLPWGLIDVTHSLLLGMNMAEARGVGALVAAAFCASAAVGLLLPQAEAPRLRGAGLVIVTLPAWGVTYGFLSSGSVLPFIGAALLSAVVAFAGTQSSPDARSAARAAVLLASLSAIALNVSAACETVVASRPFHAPDFFAAHARLYDTLRAAKLSGIVMLIPALLARAWLTPADLPRPSPGSRVLLALALVGMVALDEAGTRMALARITPDAWPPWAHVEVTPLPLGEDARSDVRRSEPPRYILAAGELRDASGQRVAQLSDAAALRAALASAPLAQREAPMGAELGERLAIMPVMDQAPTPAPLCPGRVVSVLLDRTVSMADLRAFVAAAVASGVVELDVVGPLVLSPAAKQALHQAVRAAGLEASWPLGSEDELDYTRVAGALPATGFAPLDLQRQPLTAHTALLPSPCWLTQLAGPPADSGSEAPDQPTPSTVPGTAELGERLNEMPPRATESSSFARLGSGSTPRSRWATSCWRPPRTRSATRG